MSTLQNHFWSLLQPQKLPITALKMEKKNISKSNVRIKLSTENESFKTTWVDPKTFFEPFPNPQNSPLGPKKTKKTQKLRQNQMSELKETQKMKVV